ncbi:MAG: hypothetical protein GY953_29720 [bacterium]|nr:hypothetical protein [bacterium]
MSIQTLVENSVKYAVASRREGGEVRVAVRSSGGPLEVEVSDDDPGFTPENLLAGHGLDNLNERLAAIYGNGNELRMERRDGRMVVGFRMPVRSTA